MKRFLLFAAAGLVLLETCVRGTSQGYRPVRGAWVYDIKQHNDSIYFSTSESGIFSFHPDHPGTVRRVGGCRRLPLRTFCFVKDSVLLASSYYAGVFRAAADTLLPVEWARYPAWAMKLDNEGKLWLACPSGILRQRGDSLVHFCNVRDAHDVAFFNDQVAVAHMKGISLYNRENGALVRDYARGLACWSVTSYDTLLIGGGIERCLIISNDACREIRFGPPHNILWATALDSSGMLHCATQRGLFCARLADTVAVCSGYKNICCKSVFIDNKGKIWAGLFKKPARWLFF